jgi:hypothetical protein
MGSNVQVTRRSLDGGPLPLRPLEAQPDAVATSRRPHGEHVRVQVGLASPQAGEGVGEADDLPGTLGDEEEAPRVHGGDELDGRGDLEVREAPDFALQPYASVVVGPVAGRPDEDLHGPAV